MYRRLSSCEWTLGCSVSNMQGMAPISDRTVETDP